MGAGGICPVPQARGFVVNNPIWPIRNRKKETMHPSSRFGSQTAALVAALLLVGPAGAREARPAAPAAVPQVHKLTIYNGSVPTVSYSVQGGSPHLQALCQTLEFTENEINLTKELQKLRLGIVANEQTLDTVRTSQQLGLGPISTPGNAACYAPADSALKRALIPGLAREATPATAYQLINLWEQVQTEIQAEQGKAVAAVRGKPPARQNAQPAAPVAGPMAVPQAVAQQLPMPLDPQQAVAFQQMVRQRIMPAQQLQSQAESLYVLLTCSPVSWLPSVSPRPWKKQSRANEDGAAVTASAEPPSLTVVPNRSLAVPLRPPQ